MSTPGPIAQRGHLQDDWNANRAVQYGSEMIAKQSRWFHIRNDGWWDPVEVFAIDDLVAIIVRNS